MSEICNICNRPKDPGNDAIEVCDCTLEQPHALPHVPSETVYMTPAPSVENIHFQNNNGEIISLPASMTIEEMVKRGISLTIQPKGTPLPDDWYANTD